MRHEGTCWAAGGSWDQGALRRAILTPLRDYWGRSAARGAGPAPGRVRWEREAECQDPSQAVWSSVQGFCPGRGKMGLGRIRLKVSCEDQTNMPRRKKVITEKLSGCAEFTRSRMKSRLVPAAPTPAVSYAWGTSHPFQEDSSLHWREEVTSDVARELGEIALKHSVHSASQMSLECPLPPFLLSPF